MAKVLQKLMPVTIKAKAKPGTTPFKLTDGYGEPDRIVLLDKGVCVFLPQN